MNKWWSDTGRLREKVEWQFGRWALFVIKMRWLIVIASFFVIGFLLPQLSDIRIETSVDGVLSPDDPKRLGYEAFRRQYGRDERILLIVDSEKGVFDLTFLQKLQTLHRQIEETVQQIDDVDSLINARVTRGINDALVVEELLASLPGDATQLEIIRDRVLANPLLRKNYLSVDGQSTLMLVKTDAISMSTVSRDALLEFDASEAEVTNERFLTATENARIIAQLKKIVAENTSPGFNVQIGGTPVLMEQLTQMLYDNVIRFTLISLVLIICLLAVIFRRIDICFIPPIVAMMVVVFTLGLMALIGIPISMTVQMTPTFILAISVSNSVHLFTSFFRAIDRGENKERALQYALSHSGLAITMTGLTTAGGLLSFLSADVQPVVEFGIITPIGILGALLCTLIFLPALIAILPLRTGTPRDTSNSLLQRFMRMCALFSTRRPYLIVCLWSLMVIAALFTASRIDVSHNMLMWFPDDHPLRIQTQRLNDEFGGAMFLEIEIDAGEKNALYRPLLLNQIEALQDFADGLHYDDLFIGKTVSLIDVNKELHQALNGNKIEYYRIPQDQALIAQEMLLFENSGTEDLSQFVDSQFSKARITMTLPFVDARHYLQFLNTITAKCEELFSGLAKVTLTGLMAIMGGVVDVLMLSMIHSYIIAFIVITPLMMLLLGSIRTGLLSMIPNLAPIVITLGMMGLVGIPVDLFTLLIGSIALGLAVDDTIHFMHNYQRYYYQFGDSARAVEETLRTTGVALALTTLILGVAFVIYAVSELHNLRMFAILTCFCICTALFADILLAPALMTLRSRLVGGDSAETGVSRNYRIADSTGV